MRHFLSKRRRKSISAVTLVELVAVIAIIGMMMVAISYAFVGGINVERRQQERAQEAAQTQQFEARVTRLLEAAFLAEEGAGADTNTYFIAETDISGTGTQASVLGSERITFTTFTPVPMASLDSNNTDDFETGHDALGPVGGVSEVSLGTTPIGDAGNKTGLFERLQQPSDGDPTQGGTEGLLSSDVSAVGFEFFDGTEWIAEWDTRTTGRRLPAAVRVNYTKNEDAEGVTHQFLVPILTSDVTPQNPVTAGGA
jgi:type II secretory pathway pseudopilin PulG